MPYRTAEAEKWAEEMGLLVFECASAMGRELTAYLGGAQHVRDLERWTTERGQPARVARERLETARRIAAALTPALAPQDVVAWFRDPDPGLGGISPATALHRSTTTHIHALLHARALRQASAGRPTPVG